MKTAIIVATLGLVLAVAALGEIRFKKLHMEMSGESRVRPRIVGGSEAVPHSRPYQVLLEVYDASGSGWYCGGVVVSSNYVLTAAHCGDGGATAIAILGAHNITDEAEASQVRLTSSQITIHSDYANDSIQNDIASIRLDSPIAFNENIQPVALPSRADIAETYVGKIATISGWGTTNWFTLDLLPVLNVVSIGVMANEQCEEDFSFVPVTEAQICLFSCHRTTACFGDDGGPVTVKQNEVDTLVGIVTYIDEFCVPENIFLRVTSFLDWIEDNTDLVIT